MVNQKQQRSVRTQKHYGIRTNHASNLMI